MDIKKELILLRDDKNADFSSKLIPNIPRESILGVRVPLLRGLAKKLYKANDFSHFLDSLPHEFFDENMLHSVLISEIRDFDEALKRTEEFLPFIDNWAVCDILSPKVFSRQKDALLKKIKEWVKSPLTYSCRFALGMLMQHFLDESFDEGLLEIPSQIQSDEYYINMMIAWFFATALFKKWDSSIKYIEEKRLSPWVHNKSIQKALESLRISDDKKAYLRSLKIK